MRDDLNDILRKGLVALFLIWLGIVLGMSFLATPVKFQAPHLTLPVALEVGKVTFHLLHKVEWGLFALAVIMAYLTQISKKTYLGILILVAILLVQNFWLIPILDLRIDSIVAGITPEPGHFHLFYIISEVFKSFLLGIIVFLLK
ncbi:MAG: hypothetical protein J0G29_03125 [Alphaproteobacteria bacterium]|nr:hypothetical protein [Alphaproteobacteria bacterium]OJV46362.1 MAG: hypothetical protein BGO28_03305 [Alphaproteobacteria bacterium 43-37]